MSPKHHSKYLGHVHITFSYENRNSRKKFFSLFYGIFLTVDFKELYRRLRFGVKMVFFDNLKHFEGWSGVMRVVKLSKETYDVVSHFSNPWSTSVDLLVNNFLPQNAVFCIPL